MSTYDLIDEKTYICQECGAPLVPSQHDKKKSVCMEQCGDDLYGRIIDIEMPKKWIVRNMAKCALQLPDCYKSGYYWRIVGMDGVEYEQVGKPIQRILYEWPKEAVGKELALDGFQIIVLVKRGSGKEPESDKQQDKLF